MTSGFSFLKTSFYGLISAFGISQLKTMADSFQLINDRIKALTSNSDEAQRIFDGLFQSSKYLRTSFDSMGTSFSRLNLALAESRISSEAMLGLTVSLQNTFKVAGTGISETTNTIIQIAQALGTGTIRGDEFRSIMEQNTVLAQLLAKEMGVTTGQLKQLSQEGKLTSDVMVNALAKSFDETNMKARAMGTTFEQAIAIGMDAVRYEINELNKQFDISGKFAKGIIFITNNIGLFAGAITSLIATGALLKFVTYLKAIEFSVSGLAKSTGWALLIFGLTQIVANFDLAAAYANKFFLVLQDGVFTVLKPLANSLIDFLGDSSLAKKIIGSEKDVELVKNFSKAFIGVASKNVKDDLAKVNAEIEKLRKPKTETNFEDQLLRYKKALQDFAKSYRSPVDRTKTPFYEINRLLREGIITLEEYNRRLFAIRIDIINKKIEKGTDDLADYHKELRKINQEMVSMGQIFSLNEQAALGLRDGLVRVATEYGNVAQQLSNTVYDAFNKLEDAIYEFTKTGKLSFKDFTDFVMEELTRIIIRAALLAPLSNIAGSFLSSFGAASGSGAGTAGATDLASGAAAGTAYNGKAFFGGNVIPFANGGIVDRPTYFGMSRNRTGLMGEAGAEAILPLRRDSEGRLGVSTEGGGTNVIVNVINQSNGSVQQKESTNSNGDRVIDIIILDKIKTAIAEGKLDRAMGETYGLTRRGR